MPERLVSFNPGARAGAMPVFSFLAVNQVDLPDFTSF